MPPIEFRRRSTEDELEPLYVRIAETGDVRSVAFSENTDDPDALDAAIATMRSGDVTIDRLHDKANDKWFFRFKDADTGATLFRSMPCDDEDAMEHDIDLVESHAADAPFIDDAHA